MSLNCLRHGMKPATGPRELPQGRAFKLGVAARLIPLKGVGVAIHAVAEMRRQGMEVELHIAGAGGLEACLRQQAKDLAVASSIHFLGVCNDMEGFFRTMDLLLVPSVREPFGLILLEAALQACPAVCARVDGIPEATQCGVSALCLQPKLSLSEGLQFGGTLKDFPEAVYDPAVDALTPPKFLDPAEIAAAVRSILESPKRYREMSQAAVEQVRDNYTADVFLHELDCAFARASANQTPGL
jgi:glycosyltransferase involved in cell wall biosynthesis